MIGKGNAVILNPAIIALIAGSLLLCLFTGYASVIGLRIIRSWDLESGSEQQLMLERKTYLVSTILVYLLCFELFSLYIFIYTADQLHCQFVGAMCAAGSLAVNEYGYPTLVMKIINCILCGIWMIVSHVDNKAFDYPLIKPKFKLLLVITAMVMMENVLQVNYFMRLKTDVITSCCGTLFSNTGSGVAGEMASLPSYPLKLLFYSSVGLLLRTGVHFKITGRSAAVLASVAAWLTALSTVSIISFISVHFYELPTHHCPFCLIQREYHHVGYVLYLSLFAGGVAGMGVGVLNPYTRYDSLRRVIPAVQQRLCIASMISFLIFMMIATYPMITSDFKLEGY